MKWIVDGFLLEFVIGVVWRLNSFWKFDVEFDGLCVVVFGFF